MRTMSKTEFIEMLQTTCHSFELMGIEKDFYARYYGENAIQTFELFIPMFIPLN